MARSGQFEVPHVPWVPRIRLIQFRKRAPDFRNRTSVFRNRASFSTRASVFRADTQGISQRISEDFKNVIEDYTYINDAIVSVYKKRGISTCRHFILHIIYIAKLYMYKQ